VFVDAAPRSIRLGWRQVRRHCHEFVGGEAIRDRIPSEAAQLDARSRLGHRRGHVRAMQHVAGEDQHVARLQRRLRSAKDELAAAKASGVYITRL